MKLSDRDWEDKIESMKVEYERVLQEKDMEIKKRDELMQQKEIELAQKFMEIDSLSEKIKELQQIVDLKSQDVNSILKII